MNIFYVYAYLREDKSPEHIQAILTAKAKKKLLFF